MRRAFIPLLALLAALALATAAWAGHHHAHHVHRHRTHRHHVAAATPVRRMPIAAAFAHGTPSAPLAPPADQTPDPRRVVQAYLDDLPPPPAHESVRRTIQRHLEQLDACVNGGGDGRVVVRFEISPSGTAHDGAVLLDERNDPQAASCLLAAVLSFEYPREGGASTDVTYPLVIHGGEIPYEEITQ